MQTQDAPAEIIFKLWPWLEANKNQIIGGFVAVIVGSGVWYFIAAQKAQKEADAGQALTALTMSLMANDNTAQTAGDLEQLAAKYSGTVAGKRAQLQAAAALFDTGNYPDAQAQFQKYLDANPTDALAATAELGLAASLEAQNQLDPAAAAYQRVVSLFSTSSSLQPAQLALGRIAEEQNKLTEALGHYEDVARTGISGSIGQEAAIRGSELQAKIAAAAPKPTLTKVLTPAPGSTISNTAAPISKPAVSPLPATKP